MHLSNLDIEELARYNPQYRHYNAYRALLKKLPGTVYDRSLSTLDIFSLDTDDPQAHISALSTLERMTLEDCDFVGGKAVTWHENVTDMPYHLRLDYLTKRLGCTPNEAEVIREYFVELDATPEMVDTFIRWTNKRGFDKGLQYFKDLAAELEALKPSPEDALEADAQHVYKHSYIADPGEEYESTEDEDVETSGFLINEYAGTPVSIREESFEPYSYHLVDEEDYQLPWESTQPGWYRSLLWRVRKSTDFDKLTELGKKTYESNLSRDQASVFWSEYTIKKKALERKIPLSPAARAFIQKIDHAPDGLPGLGAWLYRVQHGETNIVNPPLEREWKVIWKVYRQRKSDS